MGKYIKNLGEQIEELNDFFKNNSIIIFVSIIFTILPNILRKEGTNSFLLNLAYGMGFFMVLFLMFILILQILDKLDKPLKEINWLLALFLPMLFGFVIAYSLNFILFNPKTFALATGVYLGMVIASILMLLFMFIPIWFGRFILVKAENTKDKKTKWTILVLAFVLMSVAVPLIAYFYRRNIEDIFITPTFFIWITGIALIFSQFKKEKPKEASKPQQ